MDSAMGPVVESGVESELARLRDEVRRLKEPTEVTTGAVRAARRDLKKLRETAGGLSGPDQESALRDVDSLLRDLDRLDPGQLPERAEERGGDGPIYGGRVHKPPRDADLHRRLGPVQQYDDDT